MNITEQDILKVESYINDLIGQKEKLVFDKKDIELQMSALKIQIRTSGHIPDIKYKQICDKQFKLKRDMYAVEKSISDISGQIMQKSHLKDQLKQDFKTQGSASIRETLIELRDYYINFSSDRSRVSSMRAMGSEFAEKIEAIIKNL